MLQPVIGFTILILMSRDLILAQTTITTSKTGLFLCEISCVR